MKPALYKFFVFLMSIVTLISLYILVDKIFNKKYHSINAWQFPMLLAILIELTLIEKSLY